MSRIGKKPVIIPENVNVSFESGVFIAKGPKGELKRRIPDGYNVVIDGEKLRIEAKGKENSAKRMLLGTLRAIVANMVQGVAVGWSKKLELVGVGFRAEVTGDKLNMSLGFSHPVIFEAPAGISFKIEKNVITVEGLDKELVGLMSDKIRSVKPPEPYKGKGIRYVDEIIKRKAGKAAKAQGAA